MSSQLEDRGFSGLSLILGGALRIQNKSELEQFLEQPKAQGLVRSAPYQDVFMVIKTVGLADSLEFLPLTSRDQRRGFIDLDCWRKDNFHVHSFMEWLAAFIQCGSEETVRLARSVDPELLAYFLKQNIQVHEIDPEEPAPDAPLAWTPDRRFGIEISGEEESATMARLLLDAVFRFDPSLGYDLLDRVHWGNLVALEEEAYQNKRRRLEEIGFVDYYEALEIYCGSPVTPLQGPISPAFSEREDIPGSRMLPALFVASLSHTDYLRDGLQRLKSHEAIERITRSLAALSNRILSVYSVTPGDLEKVKPALEEVRDFLSLGIEYMSKGQQLQVLEILDSCDLQTIFKAGFSLVADLQSRANKILQAGGLQLQDRSELLLDSPELEFFSGLRRQRPLLFEGVQDCHRSSYRNFRTLADIQQSALVLDQIEVLSAQFWRLFPYHQKLIPRAKDIGSGCGNREVRFCQLLNTASMNSLLSRGFSYQALDVRAILDLTRTALASSIEKMDLENLLIGPVEQQVSRQVETAEDRKVLAMYFTRWISRCAEELAPLLRAGEIDPRFLSTLLVRCPL